MTSSLATFFPIFFKITESFIDLEDILPDWVNDNVEQCLAETVDKYEKQEEEEEEEKSVSW